MHDVYIRDETGTFRNTLESGTNAQSITSVDGGVSIALYIFLLLFPVILGSTINYSNKNRARV